jgi:hypothetical protein
VKQSSDNNCQYENWQKHNILQEENDRDRQTLPIRYHVKQKLLPLVTLIVLEILNIPQLTPSVVYEKPKFMLVETP